MSVKRQATTELNHDNWDQEDETEHEEMGSFKTASKDILEKRVIKTAKRRSQLSVDEPKKSVFSGFSGFNKAPPSSFNFLANLTNGSKNSNGSSTSSDTAVSSSLFSSKPTSPSGGLFGVSTSATPTKSPLGGTFQNSSITGSSSTQSSSAAPSTLTATKADSTSFSDSTLKIQPVSSSGDVDTAKSTAAQTPQITSTLFTVTSTSGNDNKTLFTPTNSTPFKIQPITSPATSAPNTFGVSSNSSSKSSEPEKKADDSNNDKKMKYYAKLKGLNESVSDWIKKHVEQTPLCILSPIFKDYEKYLKEIQEEYQGTDKDEKDKKEKGGSEVKADVSLPTSKAPTPVGNNTGSTLFNSNNTPPKPVFGTSNNVTTSAEKPPSFGFGATTTASSSGTGFSFGNGSASSTTATLSTSTASTGFSFGVTSTVATTSSPFSLATNTSTNNQAPFSFGIGKPFSFSSNVNQQQNAEPKETEKDEDDEPPKVEFTPIAEENSVFDKRCKIFVKKDGNFVDKGVGTLYIKKIEESGKHQLLVRANTNLGNVLLNLILSSSVPTQRMGKNNVMLVCIPTPDAKPPPTPVLIRVKTGEEADEVLETLNKYKK